MQMMSIGGGAAPVSDVLLLAPHLLPVGGVPADVGAAAGPHAATAAHAASPSATSVMTEVGSRRRMAR